MGSDAIQTTQGDIASINLGEVARIKTGKLDANASSNDGTYPFFTCAREPLRISSYSYDCECVLVAGNGDLNVKYYSGKFDAYQRTYIIESADKNRLSTRYLYHFMCHYIIPLRRQAIGGIIKYIKLGNLTGAIIPLPSLEEQRRIAAILDKADALLAKRREAIAKLDQLLQSVFLEMFGDPVANPRNWPVETIGRICKNEDSRRRPIKKSDRENRSGPYNYYGASGVIDDFDEFIFDGERLLIGEDGANLLARSAPIAHIARGKYWVNNHAHVLAENGLADLRYLEYFVEQSDISGYVTGTAQPKLNRANLDRINVPCPPIAEQKKFRHFCEHVEQQKQVSRAAEIRISELFGSCQQRAFGGRL